MSGPKPGPTQQGVLQPPLDHTIRLMSGLKRVCENYSLQMSPVGTAENAPGCNPGVPPALKWTISDSGRPTQDHPGFPARCSGDVRVCGFLHGKFNDEEHRGNICSNCDWIFADPVGTLDADCGAAPVGKASGGNR